jgi:emfourin
MKIRFERSGGFANIRLTADADTDASELIFGAARVTRSLSPDETRNLEAMIKAADFFNLSAATRPTEGADRFQYALTVEAGGKKHTVQTSEASAPAALRPILDFLTKLAMGKGTAQ